MARQITFYKIGTIVTDNEGGMSKQYAQAFKGWYIKDSKVVAPDSVKRYIISEYTQTLYEE